MRSELKDKINELGIYTPFVDDFVESYYLGVLIEKLDSSITVTEKKTGEKEEYFLTIKCEDYRWSVYYSNGKNKVLDATEDWLIDAVVDVLLKFKNFKPVE